MKYNYYTLNNAQCGLNNALKSYLPQISFNAQTSYQSEVTELPLDLSSLPFHIEIPGMCKDQYHALINLSQQVWDGGIVNNQRRLISKNSELEKQNIEISLYAVKEKVIEIYFGILAIEKHLTLLNLAESNLRNSSCLVQSMINNGMAMQSDLDLIDVELLNIEKKKTEQISAKKTYIQMLGAFINQSLSENVYLSIPIIDYNPSGSTRFNMT